MLATVDVDNSNQVERYVYYRYQGSTYWLNILDLFKSAYIHKSVPRPVLVETLI